VSGPDHHGPRACVIGWPIKHSRSPLIHGYWLKLYGLQGSYEKVAVEPEKVAGFLANLSGEGFAGCNITIPHKEAAFAAAQQKTETALKLGAVNTLWYENGVLCGDNTDVIGFLHGLDAEAPGWDKSVEKAVVLGAGGAARGIVHALLLRNIKQVTILNRTPERAQALAALFGETVAALPWDKAPEALDGAGLLVNTTSLGMAGQPPLEIDLSPLSKEAIVDDIVYVPLETPLLALAKARGFTTVGGLSMLLHQAVPGFEHWFGYRPEVTADLRALLEADVRSSS